MIEPDIATRLRDIYATHPMVMEAAAEIERLRALVEDALRGLHNDFEPDNQSALYNRIKAELKL